jgi:16S rRNA processing protein RimM
MLLIIGQITRPHGIRGEVSVDVRTDEPDQRFRTGIALATAKAVAGADPVPTGTLTIETIRPHQGRLIIQFAQVPDRNAAEELRGTLLCVDSAEVPAPTDPDEFLDHHLVGLAAVTPTGEKLGEVVAIDHAPAHDLLVVRLSAGGTGLVPFVKAIVGEVDVAGGKIVMTPPDGLFDL